MKKSELITAFCRAQLGEPYDLGDHGPNRWDCSGLTMEAVELIGLKWPHSSHRQYYMPELTERGKRSSLVRGKTCFLFNYGTRTNGQKGYVHVGIYDGARDTVIQAGGYNNRGTMDSQGYGGKGVHEDPVSGRRFKPLDHFSDWCTLRGADDEIAESEIRNGSSGAAVAVMQVYLAWAGKDIDIDGKFGPLTEAALKEYQTANGLPGNGVCDAATWAALKTVTGGSAPVGDDEPADVNDSYETIRRGDSGEIVSKLQGLLNDGGYTDDNGNALDVDGKFGPKTRAAVIKYQAAKGLKQDGIVGPLTWGKLLR